MSHIINNNHSQYSYSATYHLSLTFICSSPATYHLSHTFICSRPATYPLSLTFICSSPATYHLFRLVLTSIQDGFRFSWDGFIIILASLFSNNDHPVFSKALSFLLELREKKNVCTRFFFFSMFRVDPITLGVRGHVLIDSGHVLICLSLRQIITQVRSLYLKYI
uniref:Uncharacterized protein n=1 Tax=Cacopsylla melanoneura TaxID=428564 RepID=A0A8D8REV5_9HEMI